MHAITLNKMYPLSPYKFTVLEFRVMLLQIPGGCLLYSFRLCTHSGPILPARFNHSYICRSVQACEGNDKYSENLNLYTVEYFTLNQHETGVQIKETVNANDLNTESVSTAMFCFETLLD
jgi:hypothetical protein